MWKNAHRIGLLLAVGAGLTACADKKEEGTKPAVPATTAASAASSGAVDAPPALNLPAGPLAKVNGTEISRTEFEQKYVKMTKAFTARKKDIPENLAKRYKESILKQLIEKELLRQEITKQSVQIDGPELDKEFDDYKKMFRTDENFDRYLKSSEVTIDQIKDNIRHNIGVNKLLEKGGALTVTDAESKSYYEENKKRYEVQEQIHAAHILVKVDAKADKKAEADALKKANDFYKDATKKGADFATLAQKSSDGPTAGRGGDLNWFPRGRMVKEFDDIAFKMKAGEISKPVKTQFGYHVIKLIDRKDGRDRPFDEVKESIEKLLKNKKQRTAKQALLKDLRTNAKLETFLPEAEAAAASIGAEEEKSAAPGGLPIGPGGLPLQPGALNMPGPGSMPSLKLPPSGSATPPSAP
jgi:parvulin-like peptidyl-prolyl isomerase